MPLGFQWARCVCLKNLKTVVLKPHLKANICKKHYSTFQKTSTNLRRQTGSSLKPPKLPRGAQLRSNPMLRALICLGTRISIQTFYALLKITHVSFNVPSFRILNVKREVRWRIPDPDSAQQSTWLDDCDASNYGQKKPYGKASLLL